MYEHRPNWEPTGMTDRSRGLASRPGRVVLGVEATLSGMQALRVAVAEARRRSAPLHAVRAYGPGPPEPPLEPAPPASPRGLTGPLAGSYGMAAEPADRARIGHAAGERGALTAASIAMITRVFTDTMGGQPPDIPVRAVVLPDSPGPVLVEYACRDDDLLVLGTGRRGLLRRLRGSPVVRYCLARASCPVLVVPPPPLTRAGSPRSLLRQLRREIDHLAEGGADR